jgi:hypothetical protein
MTLASVFCFFDMVYPTPGQLKTFFLFFKVGLVLVFFMNSPQANKKQQRQLHLCEMAMYLLLWLH